MAERHVTVVDDDDPNSPVINTIKTLATKAIASDTDPFNRPAEELKSLEGTDAVFKRRVTNQIRKYNRGSGGAESKQIVEKDFVTGYNAYDVVEPPYNLEYLSKLYELSAPHFAAVNAKVANIVGLGYKFVENNKTKRNLEDVADDADKTKKLRKKLSLHKEDITEQLEGLNDEMSFVEVLSCAWRDYEVTGNGYIEIGRKKDGSIGYFGHIPAQTLRIRKKHDGFIQMSGFEVQFFAPFGAAIDPDTGEKRTISNPLGGGTPNEVIHLKKYSPTNTYYGVPDIVSAKQAVAGNEFAARFNLDYFENKAVPRYAIILKGAKLGVQAETQLLSFFETGLKGQNHRSIYIPLPGDTEDNKVSLDFEAIENGAQDASFTNYRRANLSDILMAHRVPITKISVAEGASLAVARDADKTFKEQVCAPEQRNLEKKLNKVIKELSDAFNLSLNELTLTDENTQSQIDERRRKTGVETANEQRIRRGDPAIEGGDELYDMNAQLKLGEETNAIARQTQKDNKELGEKQVAAAAAKPTAASPVTNRERDSQRSANRTDSAGEARNPKGEGRTSP